MAGVAEGRMGAARHGIDSRARKPRRESNHGPVIFAKRKVMGVNR
jgi:hypothetical protein